MIGRPADWSAEELALLRDLGHALSPRAADIAEIWARRLLERMGPPLGGNEEAFERIRDLNRWFLEGHLAKLREGDFEGVFHDNFDNDLALLRSQIETDPELQSTLSQLYLSLETCSEVISDFLQRDYATDPRLPAILALQGRLALRLGETVGKAFYQVRSEEIAQALRVTRSLLETSRELNTRAASVAGVLANLTGIVSRLVDCDKSLVFLWRESEQAYAAEAGEGFPEADFREIQSLRFRRGDFPVMDTILDGDLAAGLRDDGRVPAQMMARYGEAAYAVAPMRGSDGRRLGTLAAYRPDPVPFSRTDLEILQGVAQSAALAIENAMLVEKLEAAARIKNDFINSMSHEIRTPLNVLVGYLEVLGDRRTADASDTEIIDRMQRNAGYLLRLVNTILDVGRIEEGRIPLRIETFPAAEIVDTVREMFTSAATSRGVELRCLATADLPLLTTDRMKLLEILSNLVANAFKFTDDGSVTVRAGATDDGYVLFEVRDTGIGIDRESLAAIFDVFRQVGSSDRGGTGLGLYIVKRLSALLGGDVSVESMPGKGSTFRVWIPAVIPQRPAAPVRAIA